MISCYPFPNAGPSHLSLAPVPRSGPSKVYEASGYILLSRDRSSVYLNDEAALTADAVEALMIIVDSTWLEDGVEIISTKTPRTRMPTTIPAILSVFMAKRGLATSEDNKIL